MQFCLDCHRNPGPRLRPREAVFDFDWKPPPDQKALEQKLVRLYRIHSPEALTQCGVCHR
jgi:hypothetical protein